MYTFNGLEMGLGSLPRLSAAKTRSISAENRSGAKGGGALDDPDPHGAARDLGRGWKCSPCKRDIQPGQVYSLADIAGSGAIQSMWFGGKVTRDSILRIYWDNYRYFCDRLRRLIERYPPDPSP